MWLRPKYFTISIIALTLSLSTTGALAQSDDPASGETDSAEGPATGAADDNQDDQPEGGGERIFRPADDVYQSGGFVYVFGGLNLFDMGGINDALRPFGYGEMGDLFLYAGTGGFVTVRQWLFGLETYLVGRSRSDGGSNTSSLVGTYWLAQVAYMFNLGPTHLYPIFGAGFASFDLDLVEGTEQSFPEAVANPPQQQTLALQSGVIQLSIGLDYLFENVRRADRVSGVLLGLRIGYLFAPGGWRWNIRGATVTEAPDMPVGLGLLSVVVGYGTWRVEELFSLSPSPQSGH